MEVGGKGEGRTNIVTARLYSTESRCTLNAAPATFIHCTHARAEGGSLGNIEKPVDHLTFDRMLQILNIVRDRDSECQ